VRNTIVRDERTYRRGLVMGLTLAEVMLLVLFALLLLFGWVVRQDAGDRDLGEKLRPLLPIGATEGSTQENEFTDAVQELKTSAEVGKAILAALVPSNRRLSQEQTRSAVDRARGLLDLGKAAETAIGPNTTGAAAVSAAQEALAVAKTEYEKARNAEGQGSARIWLQGLIKNQPKGQNGNGLVFPSCVEVDGKPAYVFDVTLKSASLIITDNMLPEMQKWNQETAPIRTGVDVSNGEFESMTNPLLEWSRKNQCRFFVRVMDATLADQKAIYKIRLRTVEGHFYKHLVESDVDRF
jgi:hypothetical protein